MINTLKATVTFLWHFAAGISFVAVPIGLIAGILLGAAYIASL